MFFEKNFFFQIAIEYFLWAQSPSTKYLKVRSNVTLHTRKKIMVMRRVYQKISPNEKYLAKVLRGTPITHGFLPARTI